MIDCVDCATSHFFGDAIASQHRLRHRIFVERQQWEVSCFNRMEFDQFDTPATTYFIWRDEHGDARGVARTSPTQRPYMLQQVFPELVTKEQLPNDPGVWEGSRIGIDRDLPPDMRQRVLGELFCAYLEFGLLKDIERYLILMPLYMLRKLTSVGWSTELVGPTRKIDRISVAAASIAVSSAILDSVRANMRIEGPILRTAEEILRSDLLSKQRAA